VFDILTLKMPREGNKNQNEANEREKREKPIRIAGWIAHANVS
jgi:hypothetical protein